MFKFSVDPEYVSVDEISQVEKSNGLFRLLQMGYSNHTPVVIRPDDVLNTIVCLWAKYIVLNAEKFRSFFVNHEGKKVLTYKAGGTYHQSRLQEFMSGLMELVKADQNDDNLGWANIRYSTTMPIDRLVRSAALLASQKEYYEYRVMLCCGFSEVTLEGDKKDWDLLEMAVQCMPIPDDEDLAKWQKRLLNTIAGMRSGEEDFWQKCVRRIGFGSGPADYDGWILDFNPFDEKGKWMKTMENDDILNLTVDFEILVDDNGHEFTVVVEAGPTELTARDDKLAVKNVFSVTEKESDKPPMTLEQAFG